jgi:lipoprotein-anchoring transpeptidase ErfK/SrfK
MSSLHRNIRHQLASAKRALLGAFAAAALIASAGAANAAATVSADPKQKVEIVIDKSTQRMTVYVGGEKRHVFTVSTGRAGYATPSGTFRPTHQVPMAISVKYGNTPMPHSIFFTGVGHAIHATKAVAQLGRVASHGCIRLSPADAKTVYELVKDKGLHNTTIKIV